MESNKTHQNEELKNRNDDDSANTDIRTEIEIKLERINRILSMGRSVLGISLTIIILLIFALIYGEAGSASYYACIFTMFLNVLFIPYIIYMINKYMKTKKSIKDDLAYSVLEKMEEVLVNTHISKKNHDEEYSYRKLGKT